MMTEIVLPGLSKYIGEVQQRETEARKQRDREILERREQSEQTHQQRVADSEYLKKSKALRILLRASAMMAEAGIKNYVALTGLAYDTEPMQLKISWDHKTVLTNNDFGDDWSWKEVNIGVERSKSGRVVGMRINSDPPDTKGFVSKLKPEVLAEAIDRAFQEPVEIPKAGYPHWFGGENYWHLITRADGQGAS